MTIEKKRIIVTGSASGMGEATLNAYVKAGAHVIVSFIIEWATWLVSIVPLTFTAVEIYKN